MASEILSGSTGVSELDTIHGYQLALADRYHMEVLYSQVLYTPCTKKFAEKPCMPVSADDLAHQLDNAVSMSKLERLYRE